MDARDLDMLGMNLAEVGTDLISRAEAIETVTKCNAKDMSGFDWIRMQEAVDKLKDLPSAQPCMQTCKSMYADVSDLVSRQAALEALRTCYDTDRIDMDNGDEYIDYNDAVGEIEELPSAQPEPCEDAVGRDAVVRFLDDWISALDANCHHQSMADLKIVKNDFKNLPSAQPMRKSGKWEIYVISMLDGEGCRCSECGFEGTPYWDFCPNCGADMRG